MTPIARIVKRTRHAALLLGVALAAAAQSGGDWRDWRYSAPVQTGEATDARLVRVKLPSWVTARAQPGWSDLRVIDERGAETPFVLQAREEVRQSESRAAELLEVTFLPGESTQGIVDLGAGAGVHNSIEVQTTETDFFAWVQVAISVDAADWRILRERVPIYRFRGEGLEGNRTIRYGDSMSRYLRLRVLNGSKRFPLTGVNVAHDRVTEAEREQVTANFHRDPAARAPKQQTWWSADIGTVLPISEIRFAVPEPEFYRAVRVSASRDGTTWWTAGSGDIYRIRSKGFSAEDSDRERTRLRMTETRARYWRVEFVDRNDPPLENLGITLYQTPRRVVFRQEPGRAYRLLYGNEKAASPVYSLARLLDAREVESAPELALGAEVAITAEAPVVPWSERHKYLLWVAVGAAVAVLGFLAIRAMKS